MKTRSILALFALTAAALCAAAPLCPAQQATPTPSVGYVDAFKPTGATSLPERKARTSSRLSMRLTGGEAQLLLNFRSLYQDVWKNSDGLTPQQVCDALGTKAGNLFIIAGYMAGALYQIDPLGLGSMLSPPPGYAATINQDGTVTVTYTAPAPSPSPTP